jgi:hypothetical protein
MPNPGVLVNPPGSLRWLSWQLPRKAAQALRASAAGISNRIAVPHFLDPPSTAVDSP